MIIKFKATEFGVSDDGYALVCGASNSKSKDEYHYITLQRSSDPGDKDDWGIHFEIDDQANGGYDLLKACECNPSMLTCNLSKGVKWHPDLVMVQVELPRSKKQYSEFIEALGRIFRDRKKDLKI